MSRSRAVTTSVALALLGVAASGCGRSPIVVLTGEPPAVTSCADDSFVPAGEIRSYDVEFRLTVDDIWEGAIDGSRIADPPNANNWTAGDEVFRSLDSGCHTFAVHGRDAARVIVGFIGAVRIDGEPTFLTGDGHWRVTDTEPDADWTTITYDDASWATASPCRDVVPWGQDWPAPFYDAGANWIWHDPDCRSLGEAWFRLSFVLP